MLSKIVSWVGGSILTGALALASSGATAPQNHIPKAAPAPDKCVCADSNFDAAIDNLDENLMDLKLSQLDVAALATDEINAAMDAVQDAREEQENGNSFQILSSSSSGGWLGVRTEEVTSAKAKELNLPAERGALVSSVTEDSPAAKAGLKTGDVITEFDGQRVESTMSLVRLVREVPAGRKVSVIVWRDGHSQSITAEIGTRRSMRSLDGDHFYVEAPDVHVEIPSTPEIAPMPPMPPMAIGPFSNFRMFGAPAIGIDAEDLSGQLGNYFGAPDGEGILVREVMPGTPAEKAGLKAGDVIVRFDGKRVKDTNDLRSALRDKVSKAREGSDSGKEASAGADLSVLRSGKETTIHVELELPRPRARAAHRVAV